MSEPQPDVRVGDAERRAVDERLHRAVGDGVLSLSEYDERARDVWAARTRGELAAVVRDLPTGSEVVPSGTPAAGRTGARHSLAVLGEDRLEGPVAPGQAVAGYAVLGQSHLDLRRSDLPAEVRVRAVAVLGEVEVLVPEGATVHLSGAAVLGQRSVSTGPAVPGGPVVHVDGLAVLGSVHVRSTPVGAVPTVNLVSPSRGGRLAHRHGGRRRLVGLGIAAIVLANVFGVGGHHGDPGGSADRTIVVQPGEVQKELPRGSGDLTVVVPDGVRVIDATRAGSGEVDCATACTLQSDRVVRLTGGGGSGDVDIETTSEH